MSLRLVRPNAPIDWKAVERSARKVVVLAINHEDEPGRELDIVEAWMQAARLFKAAAVGCPGPAMARQLLYEAQQCCYRGAAAFDTAGHQLHEEISNLE